MLRRQRLNLSHRPFLWGTLSRQQQLAGTCFIWGVDDWERCVWEVKDTKFMEQCALTIYPQRKGGFVVWAMVSASGRTYGSSDKMCKRIQCNNVIMHLCAWRFSART